MKYSDTRFNDNVTIVFIFVRAFPQSPALGLETMGFHKVLRLWSVFVCTAWVCHDWQTCTLVGVKRTLVLDMMMTLCLLQHTFPHSLPSLLVIIHYHTSAENFHCQPHGKTLLLSFLFVSTIIQLHFLLSSLSSFML